MSSLQQGRWMVFCDRGQLPRTTERAVPPAEPGPCPGMCASSWLSVGRGGDRGVWEGSSDFQWLGHLPSWACAKPAAAALNWQPALVGRSLASVAPALSSLNRAMWRLGQKLLPWSGYKESLKFLKLYVPLGSFQGLKIHCLHLIL